MPDEVIRSKNPTQDQIASEKLDVSLDKWATDVLNANRGVTKSGIPRLNMYVGKYYNDNPIKAIPLIGQDLADWMAEKQYEARRKNDNNSVPFWAVLGDKRPKSMRAVSPEEDSIINGMRTINMDKVFEMARSTFTDAQQKNISRVMPDPSMPPNLILMHAIDYKLNHTLSKYVRGNQSIQAMINKAAKMDVDEVGEQNPNLILSYNDKKKKLEDNLINSISGTENFKDYRNFLVAKGSNSLIGNDGKPARTHTLLNSGDFNPLVYGVGSINNFFQRYADPGKDINFLNDPDAFSDDLLDSEEQSSMNRTSSEKRIQSYIKKSKENKVFFNAWRAQRNAR